MKVIIKKCMPKLECMSTNTQSITRKNIIQIQRYFKRFILIKKNCKNFMIKKPEKSKKSGTQSRTQRIAALDSNFDGGGKWKWQVSSGIVSILESKEEPLSQNHHYQIYGGALLTTSPICDASNESSLVVSQEQSSGPVQNLSRTRNQKKATRGGVKRNPRSKPIKKERKPKQPKTLKKLRPRRPRTNRPLPLRIKERIASGNFTYQNPRKNTPKRASNFLRAQLKSLGVDVEGFDEKRNRPAYLQICFMHLRDCLTVSEFRTFMQRYRQWLKQETVWQQSLFDQYGDQVSECYIKDFELAECSSYMFEEKKQLESLITFFGTGRESEYLGENIILYIEEVRWLYEEQKKIPIPIPELKKLEEMNQIGEKHQSSLKRTMTQVVKQHEQERFIDEVLD